MGRRFGFVKYKEVYDVEELGKRLEGVKLRETKLKINKARFNRDGKDKQQDLTRKGRAIGW